MTGTGSKPNQGVLVPSSIQVDGSGCKLKKFENVPQWVRVCTAHVPPDESRANRAGEQSAGQPGNGRLTLEGSRVQAL
jgi:hypothetical protein